MHTVQRLLTPPLWHCRRWVNGAGSAQQRPALCPTACCRSCLTFCRGARWPGGVFADCAAAFDTLARRFIGCNTVRGRAVREVACYCSGLLAPPAANATGNTTAPRTGP